jgi:hypothetical protein
MTVRGMSQEDGLPEFFAVSKCFTMVQPGDFEEICFHSRASAVIDSFGLSESDRKPLTYFRICL